MMFRSYSNTSVYFLRDYVAKATVIMLSSRVKICLRAKTHLVFHWCLYNNGEYFSSLSAIFTSFQGDIVFQKISKFSSKFYYLHYVSKYAIQFFNCYVFMSK